MAESSFDILNQIVSGGSEAADWVSRFRAAQVKKAAEQAQTTANEITGAGAVTSGAKGATPTDDAFSMFMKAIAQVESGGRYKALGSWVNGDRAYGKYQIMGANVPSWTKAALGTSMTPEEFLQDKQAQEATAQYHLWNYYKNYGPRKSAMAWNQGVGGMQQGWGTDYAKMVMDNMRNYGYTKGMSSGQQPSSSGGYSSGGGWVSPVAGFAQGGATSGYGWRINPVSGQRSFHEGTDYGAATGTRVGAAHGGQIVESGWDPIYGNRVIIETPKGKQILYGHLNNINDRWEVGDSVNAGQRIGAVGSTGWSTGPHLHFGVYSPSGDPLNPQKFINRMTGQPGASSNGSSGGSGYSSQQAQQQQAAQAQQNATSAVGDKFSQILRNLGL